MTTGFFGLQWGDSQPGSLTIQEGQPHHGKTRLHHSTEQGHNLEIYRDQQVLSWTFGAMEASFDHNILTVNGPLVDTPLFERAIVPTIALLEYPGRVAFHASAIGRDGCATLFVGPSGTGKSTTATELATHHDFEFLNDDICLVDTSLQVFPGPAWAWLWTDAPEKQRRFFSRTQQPWKLSRLVVLRRGTPHARSLSAIEAIHDVLGAVFRFSDDPQTTSNFVRNACEILRNVEIWEFAFEPNPDGRPDHVAALLKLLDAP